MLDLDPLALTWIYGEYYVPVQELLGPVDPSGDTSRLPPQAWVIVVNAPMAASFPTTIDASRCYATQQNVPLYIEVVDETARSEV